MGDPGVDQVGVGRARRRDREGLLTEQSPVAETGVAIPAVRVEDPQLRPSARWTRAVPGHDHLRPLADDITAEPDPVPPGQLQADPRRLLEHIPEALRKPGGFDDDEQGLRMTGERRQATQTFGHPGPRAPGTPPSLESVRPARGRKIQDEGIDDASLEQRADHGQPLVERGGRQQHEPLEPDTPGDRLDRVEAPREIDIARDPSGGLRLREQPQREGGRPARPVPPDGHAPRPRKAAGPQDRIERREPRSDDRGCPGRSRHRRLERQRSDRERPGHCAARLPGRPPPGRRSRAGGAGPGSLLPAGTRGSGSPAGLERLQRRAQRAVVCHVLMIEQMFYFSRGDTSESG